MCSPERLKHHHSHILSHSVILVLNKDQLAGSTGQRVTEQQLPVPIQILAWDKLGTNIIPERKQVLH